MNKKIISIFFLLVIMVLLVFAYSYYTQITTEEKSYEYSSMDSFDDKDISDEIDKLLIDEDYEVEIGEMI